MAVIYAENNGPSMLSTLSGLASLAGAFIPGAQVLTPLGMGLGAIDAAQKGNMTEMSNAIKGIKSGDWKKSNDSDTSKSSVKNVANKVSNVANKVQPTVQQQEYENLAKTWGPAPAYYGTTPYPYTTNIYGGGSLWPR